MRPTSRNNISIPLVQKEKKKGTKMGDPYIGLDSEPKDDEAVVTLTGTDPNTGQVLTFPLRRTVARNLIYLGDENTDNIVQNFFRKIAIQFSEDKSLRNADGVLDEEEFVKSFDGLEIVTEKKSELLEKLTENNRLLQLAIDKMAKSTGPSQADAMIQVCKLGEVSKKLQHKLDLRSRQKDEDEEEEVKEVPAPK